MATNNPVVNAILNATKNQETRYAMLLGSYLESGWDPTAVGDQGTSFGPYQMHIGGALTAAGGTSAQAEDPVWATNAMLGAYQNAISQIDPALWNSNPELAAEQAAVIAEAPAQSYIQSHGQTGVDVAWKAVQDALKGIVSTTGTPTAANASPGGLTGLIDTGVKDAVTGIGTSFLGIFGIQSAKDFFIRIGLIILGGTLLYVGISKAFNVNPVAKVTESAGTIAEVGGVVTGQPEIATAGGIAHSTGNRAMGRGDR